MSDIEVITPDTLLFAGTRYRCAIGKGGFERGRRSEGSGTTPTGRFALRECWYRADRLPPPQTCLPLRGIQPDDGWCDDAAHPDYNLHVKLPFTASHEKLWREDRIYDLFVPLGYNDAPIVPGAGSAIFLHISRPAYEGTEGCVALAVSDLLEILGKIDNKTHILINPA